MSTTSPTDAAMPTVEGAGGATLVNPPEPPPVPAAQPEREFTVEARSQRQMVTRRFFRHRLAIVGLVVLLFILLVSTVGASLWKYSYDEILPKPDPRGAPTLDVVPWLDGDGVAFGDHPFGQDNVGHDHLARTLRGAQKSIQIALVVALVATVLGTLIGAVSGYFGGGADTTLMRFTDVILTIPLLVVAAAIGRNLSGGPFMLALVLGFLTWTGLARVIRSEFLSLREKEYVEAARALGVPDHRIITKHMLPACVGLIIVNATLAVATAVLLETALSFLGFGVKPPDTSLGQIVSEYQNAFSTRPWLFWWPGLFIIAIALSINFIGDGLRDAFDPKQNRVRS
jgi:glutathione transport system permease protein